MSGGSDVTRRGKSGGRSSPQMLWPLGRRVKARRPGASAPGRGRGVALFDRNCSRFDGSAVHRAEEREGAGSREAHLEGAGGLNRRGRDRGIVERDAVGVVPGPDPGNAAADGHRDRRGVVPVVEDDDRGRIERAGAVGSRAPAAGASRPGSRYCRTGPASIRRSIRRQRSLLAREMPALCGASCLLAETAANREISENKGPKWGLTYPPSGGY